VLQAAIVSVLNDLHALKTLVDTAAVPADGRLIDTFAANADGNSGTRQERLNRLMCVHARAHTPQAGPASSSMADWFLVVAS
jgi:hypothetical protein